MEQDCLRNDARIKQPGCTEATGRGTPNITTQPTHIPHTSFRNGIPGQCTPRKPPQWSRSRLHARSEERIYFSQVFGAGPRGPGPGAWGLGAGSGPGVGRLGGKSRGPVRGPAWAWGLSPPPQAGGLRAPGPAPWAPKPPSPGPPVCRSSALVFPELRDI